MKTYRSEDLASGDVATWLYDEAMGLVTNKVYADGKNTILLWDYSATFEYCTENRMPMMRERASASWRKIPNAN